MGGDGGVKATQRRFVRGTADSILDRADALNAKEKRIRQANACAQSGNRLQEPIVACELGYLFNKDDLLQALLHKHLNEAFAHIRGLKDIRTLNFFKNPDYNPSDPSSHRYCCPITMMEFSGHHPFVFIWSSGAVLSEKGFKEIGVEGLQSEYGPFVAEDVIHLIPNDEDRGKNLQAMIHRRAVIGRDKLVSKKRAKEGTQASHKESQKSVEDTGDGRHTKLSKLTSTEAVVKSAQELVQKHEASSKVFKGLFHKEKKTAEGERDLFIGTTGIRYSVV